MLIPTFRHLWAAVLATAPPAYDQRLPDQRWTTYLVLDAHADQALVAINLGLSPRVGPLPCAAAGGYVERDRAPATIGGASAPR